MVRLGADSLRGSEVALTIAIPTYKRPELLDRLLVEVRRQCEALNSLTGGSSGILVADNDPGGSAREVVEGHPSVRYLPVLTPGIAAVRAACLRAAEGDVLQFIDDDEQPDDDWLTEMVGCWLASGRPAALAGSVVPRFDTPPSDWIVAGRFFERRRPPSGTLLPAAPAGNLLLDLHQVRELGVDFDARLGLRGGEDTLFSTQLSAAGGRIAFCREGVIHDLVPDARNNRAWVLKRARHQGATTSTVALWEVGGLRRLTVSGALVVGGAARFGLGVGRAVMGKLSRSLVHDARGSRLAARGLGIMMGALRQDPGEYARSGSAPPIGGDSASEAFSGPAFGARLAAALAADPVAERDLGVVVVNYGAHSLLRRNLLEGLAEAAGAQIIVVDNFSSHQERATLRELATERGWTLVEPERNLGFGEGVNAGVLAAAERGCRVFVTLNPDASADPHVLVGLRRVVDSRPRSLVSPFVVGSDGQVRFRGSTVSMRNGQMRGGWVQDDDDPEWKNWLTGACLAFTGDTFVDLGGFADEYFLYWEDVDLSRRAAALGIPLILRPELQVVHDEGGTHTTVGSRAKSPIYYYYNTRNRLVFGARLAATGQHAAWLLATPRETWRIWLRGGRRQLLSQPQGLLAALRGSLDGLRSYRRNSLAALLRVVPDPEAHTPSHPLSGNSPDLIDEEPRGTATAHPHDRS